MNYDEILTRLGTDENIIELSTTPGRAFILLAQLQLALQTPGNDGAGATIAQEMAEHLADAICHFIPEARELIDQGWDPAYNVSQDYFEAEFPFEGGEDCPECGGSTSGILNSDWRRCNECLHDFLPSGVDRHADE